MSQVIIVSNRLPISVKKEDGELIFYPSLGGLATGLSSYVGDRRNIWIGWPGVASDDLTEDDKVAIVNRLAKNNCVPVFLSRRQIRDFYNGYSNTVLWPLLHNLPSQRIDPEEYKRWWQSYRSVNQLFAEAVLSFGGLGSHIWVHDYQLLLVPSLIRAERHEASIGFFLHTPLPKTKAFSRLPEATRLLQGILGADLIGFHTLGYIDNFLANCSASKLGTVNDHQVTVGKRTVQVAHLPMGIDYKKYAQAGRSRDVRAAAKRYRRKYGRRRKVIVAVDRMDPSKGLRRRLRAYRTLLEEQPEYRGKVVFAMVAAPSRTDIPAYQSLGRDLSALVADINKTYGTRDWQPVDYMNVAQPFEEVTALFQVADVAFIAPLRDGMNLAAKEFVASNRGKGVLILSETAGAAEELRDGALLVNPRRQESMVAALHEALTMSRRELRRRLKRMQHELSINTVNEWAKSFVDTLQKPVPGTPRLRTHTLRSRNTHQLSLDYVRSTKRLLLFDYDGTLVPFTENYHDAKPPKRLLSLLTKLASDKRNDVVLISGRSSDDLGEWFGDLPIGIVAEHGAMVKKANQKWQTIERNEATWQRAIKPELEKYAALTPKAHVETKPHTLVWHYRGSPPYYSQKYVTIIKRTLKPILKTYGLGLFQGNKILEIKDPRVNKGVAVERWVRPAYEFIMAIGDDYTDEQLFEVLRDNAYTIKVGRGLTNAKFRLPSHVEVIELLQDLAK